MFGTLGMQEIVVIFILALLLFGPKELPKLGRTFGKALTEFRRAQNELKSTFDREMKSLEQETESLKEVTKEYQYDTYNYDYSSYDSGTYGDAYAKTDSQGSTDSTATNVSTPSASAPQGAESSAAPEGTIAHGSEIAVNGSTTHPAGTPEPVTSGSTTEGSKPAEHQA